MSVFDVSDAMDEIYRTPAILLAADLTELRARSARLERERDSERVARLKAEAERDAAQDVKSMWPSLLATAQRERDEALALLSKAREAWAAVSTIYVLGQGDPRFRAGWADLAKILGTGETT